MDYGLATLLRRSGMTEIDKLLIWRGAGADHI
jgi:hypothetical protein